MRGMCMKMSGGRQAVRCRLQRTAAGCAVAVQEPPTADRGTERLAAAGSGSLTLAQTHTGGRRRERDRQESRAARSDHLAQISPVAACELSWDRTGEPPLQYASWNHYYVVRIFDQANTHLVP